MDRNNERFPQQEAPQKNTDNAFVKVGEDGRPQMGESGQEQPAQASKEEEEKKES